MRGWGWRKSKMRDRQRCTRHVIHSKMWIESKVFYATLNRGHEKVHLYHLMYRKFWLRCCIDIAPPPDTRLVEFCFERGPNLWKAAPKAVLKNHGFLAFELCNLVVAGFKVLDRKTKSFVALPFHMDYLRGGMELSKIWRKDYRVVPIESCRSVLQTLRLAQKEEK